MAAEILDLVGIAVGRAALDGARQVEDDRVFGRRAELVKHALADLDGIIRLRARKAFGRILIADVDVGMLHQFVGKLFDQPRAADGDVRNAVHVLLEHDLALQS